MKDYNIFKEKLNSLIKIKSVQSAKKENAPFGEGPCKALNEFLNIAKELGFESINYDNYAGEVVFGRGEEIGIIGHVDVVPEGNGWETPPYELTEKDGYLIGRGVGDDKAPLLLCLFALKELKESGIVPNKKFRLFIGTNEESGWKDVLYLKTKTTLPEYGFSPDGNFPVSYAEKGMTEVEFSIPKCQNFYAVTGGTVVNAVCGEASAIQTTPINYDILNKYGLKADGKKIISIGKSCHGSCPTLGKNAIKPLLEYFCECGENLKNVIDCLFNDKFGLTKNSNEQGSVTCSPDLIEERDNNIIITCDLRIPAPLTLSDLLPVFDKFNIEYKTKVRHNPLLVEKEGDFVNALLSAYNGITGENGKAISQSGSTFARAFTKGCAFGPEFPNEKSSIHEPNEKVSISSLLKTYEIYKTAIFNLAKQ